MRVRCVNVDKLFKTKGLTLSKEYDVEYFDDRYYNVIDDTGVECCYLISRFQPVSEKEDDMKKAKKFLGGLLHNETVFGSSYIDANLAKELTDLLGEYAPEKIRRQADDLCKDCDPVEAPKCGRCLGS